MDYYQDLLNRHDSVTSEILDLLRKIDSGIIEDHEGTEWGIRQIASHLATVHRSYFPVFENLKQGIEINTPWIGNIRFIREFMGRTILKSVLPDNSKKQGTFQTWEPQDLVSTEEFAEVQEKTRQFIKDLEKEAESGKRISSPVNRNIVYDLKMAFAIIVAHEERHLKQMQRRIGRESSE